MKKFAAFDIDGTLIRWQLYHALVDGLVKYGHIDPSSFPDIKEARMTWKNREDPEAFKQYEIKLVEFYNAALTTLKKNAFNEVVDDVFEEYKNQTYVYTKTLLKDLKKKGYLLFAISGSQTQIVSKIAEHYGFDDFLATVLVEKNGKFSGDSILPHLNKDKALQDLATKHEATFENSYAIGDSLGDAKMMDLVENPIAFNPEKKLFDYAREKGWKVVVERKNMIYELESSNGKYELIS